MAISPNSLNEHHIGKRISLATPFEKITGVLTDFYGSLDEDNEAIVIIEINEEQYVCIESDKIELL